MDELLVERVMRLAEQVQRGGNPTILCGEAVMILRRLLHLHPSECGAAMRRLLTRDERPSDGRHFAPAEDN